MFARRSQLLALQCLASDLGATLLAFPMAYLLRARVLPHLSSLGPIYPITTYWPLLLAVMLLWPLVGYAIGAYGRVDPRNRLQLTRDALAIVLFGSTVAFATLYLFRGEYISRSLVVTLGVVDAVFLVLGRWTLFSAGAWFRERLERYRYFLIVGTGGAARELAHYIEDGHGLGDRLVGFVHTGDTPDDLAVGYRIFGLEQVAALLESEAIDEIIFAVGPGELPQLEPLMRRCEEEGVHTRVHLDFLPLNVSRVYLENLREVPLLTFASSPEGDRILLFLKRVVDVALSAFWLVVLSPLVLAIALLVKFTSQGPVIYRQTRCGIGGRRFTLYKFRSMVEGADALRADLELHNEVEGPVFKIANDPRMTTVGRWLRRFSLDELPQLWNILRGDMSFVGPRPPLPEEVSQYEVWQRRRLRMRPGLTCLWAIEGRSGIKFDRWMQLDLDYIDHWSLWLDMKIIVKTIPLVLRGRGAF